MTHYAICTIAMIRQGRAGLVVACRTLDVIPLNLCGDDLCEHGVSFFLVGLSALLYGFYPSFVYLLAHVEIAFIFFLIPQIYSWRWQTAKPKQLVSAVPHTPLHNLIVLGELVYMMFITCWRCEKLSCLGLMIILVAALMLSSDLVAARLQPQSISSKSIPTIAFLRHLASRYPAARSSCLVGQSGWQPAAGIVCNRALREQFLFLASHPSNLWNSDNNHLVPSCALCFLRWLQSRQIAAGVLYLTDSNMYELAAAKFDAGVFPTIETVVLWKMHHNVERMMRVMATVCPNMTFLSIATTPLPLGQAYTPIKSWDFVSNFTNAKLKKLDILSTSRSRSDGPIVDASTLTMLGQTPKLQQFNVCLTALNNDAAAAFMKLFQNLQQLTIVSQTATSASLSTNSIIQLLIACQQLQDLDIRQFAGTAQDVLIILEAGRHHSHHLTSFGIFDLCCDELALAAEVLEDHSNWLDAVRLGGMQYRRNDSFLKLFTNNEHTAVTMVDAGLLARIIAALLDCHQSIRKLEVAFPESSSSIAICLGIIWERIGADLVEVTVHHQGGGLSDDMLCLLAECCPKLKALRLVTSNAALVTDAGMDALFRGCPNLKNLHVDNGPLITARTLESILHYRLHLETFTWKTIGFDQVEYMLLRSDHLKMFRKQAKKQQLLPVPLLFQRGIPHAYPANIQLYEPPVVEPPSRNVHGQRLKQCAGWFIQQQPTTENGVTTSK